MADDDPAAAAASSSAAGDDDDEGTDTDASNSDHAASYQQDPPPLPDATSAAPPPPAAEPTRAVPTPPPQPQGAAVTEDSRRLFQRLWTDEEELLILRGFLDFTARRGTTFASHQYDTAPFYEEIRRRLSFDFTKNQLIEKLRRLKKKYRVCAARMAAQGAAFAFRSAHEGAIYDVARHIWQPAFRRDGAGGGDRSDEDDINPAAAAGAIPAVMEDGGGGSASAPTPRGRRGRRVRRRTVLELEAPTLPATSALMLNDVVQEPLVVAVENLAPAIAPPPPVLAPLPSPVTAGGATEEAVRSVLSPLLKELISSVTVAGQTELALGSGIGFGGIGGTDILGLGFGVTGLNPGVPSDEKWRQQQIMELEVYLKRIELVREQVTSALEELRSTEG
ncbi:probable transcription factor At3g04930 [Phragmites australis]|uniref:probable transcription factor At3g04930 n=1 Tax=Phragmites australis TaxID=29695 RepID=UPI002D76D41F|nr:probable transcription factor At3g04930 [Phragmites australis]